jgi:hypothetical protein
MNLSFEMFYGVMGFIGAVLYTRSQARSECARLLACIGLGVSGIEQKTRCVYETQMPPRVTNSIDSHAYVKAFEK